jgi:ribonuclease E
MLINATQEEELRMAMVDGQRLYDLNIELPSSERKKANIYKGTITRIEPSLEAAFVNYGAERHGFLPLKEISSEYFVAEVEKGGKPNIKQVLKEGQDIVVQIDKEERGNKGAALTTYVSLAGRFIVLKPNKSRSGGVSRRIMGDERDFARESLSEVEVPAGMSVILRTAGIDRSGEELAWDLENLLAVWEAIKKVVVERPSPFLIYRESNAIVRALRDYLTNEIGEILVDDEKTFEEAREFIDQVMPHNQRKLKHYTDAVPLFTRYQIETQIESAFAHSVTLPSGGSLVIDHTEALVSIDINSARATKGGDIEATALSTNLEAAEEIARQLRLRDLGGLIVIDFIDMGPQRNQRDVENRLRDAVRMDRARVQIGKITRFGLLEMSRQRLRPSLGESSYLTCPRCSGIGNIRSVESLALAILRIIGEEARKERTAKVIAQLPVEVATYLLNEKRNWVQNLESRENTQVVLVANSGLETPHYHVRRVRDDQVELPENTGISYTLTEIDSEPDVPQTMQDRKVADPAAVETLTPTTPAPIRKKAKGPGLFAWLAELFSSPPKPKKAKPRRPQSRTRSQTDSRGRGSQRGRRRPDPKKSSAAKTPERKKQQRKKKTRGEDSGRKPLEARRDDRKDARPDRKPSDKSRDDGRKEARDESAGEGRKTGNKRRSRGGRRRRTRNDENAAAPRSEDKVAEQSPAGPETNPKKAVDAPQIVSMIAEAPVEARPAASDRNDSPPPSYDDTQPELPVHDVSMDEPPAPPAEAEATKPIEASSASKEAAEKQARDNGADEATPQGRLLPWEPPVSAPAPAEPASEEPPPKT